MKVRLIAWWTLSSPGHLYQSIHKSVFILNKIQNGLFHHIFCYEWKVGIENEYHVDQLK